MWSNPLTSAMLPTIRILMPRFPLCPLLDKPLLFWEFFLQTPKNRLRSDLPCLPNGICKLRNIYKEFFISFLLSKHITDQWNRFFFIINYISKLYNHNQNNGDE